MTVEAHDGRRGIGALLRDLAEGSATLIRGEVRLATIEVREAVSAIGKGTVLVATGAVLSLLGGLSLLAGIVLLIGDQWLPADRYWLASLIVLVIAGLVAAWFARLGTARVSPQRLAPDETATTLKEDVEWLKQRRTSGATSS